MAGANISMQHSSVNSNTAVTLLNTRVSYAWKNLIKSDPIVGKYDISEVNFGGFEAPVIVIEGHLDIEDQSVNELTQELLIEFAALRHETAITLTVPCGNTPQKLKGRPAAGYDTDGTMTLQNTFLVRIMDFNINFDNSSQQGRFWDYAITLVEST